MQTEAALSLTYLVTQVLASISLFLPKIFGAFFAFVVGAFVAKLIKNLAFRILHGLRASSIVTKTPLGEVLSSEDVGNRVEEIASSICYWLVMLVTVHTTVAILGLTSLTQMLTVILSYIPRIISAVFVLAFGTLLAGWMEGLVKNSIREISPNSALLLGKLTSYMVMTLVLLTALSELGIASEFLMILFVGVIGGMALALGLAVGLGSKDLVNTMLMTWYNTTILGKTNTNTVETVTTAIEKPVAPKRKK